MKKIVFFGEVLIDFITTNFTDDLLSAEGFKWHFGGSPANIAKSLADLEIEVTIVGKVGN
ncbi:MAG TPA: sugar kinase, partial [Thermotogae bacterium]|nr:sugar kinase [Thermotogota bacterium]